MSDTDDGFDEEAVREELRQKYEDEREDREATARMSELLLQGATMTNQHCDRCGTPVFRYDGESFCPNCQHEAEQAQTQEQADSAQRDAPAEQTADNVMSENLETVNRTAGFYEAVERMSDRAVRRLPVTDENDELVGILTSDDLTTLLADEQQGLSEVIEAQRSPYDE
jgi:UPF0148 protein